jgi:hypothetical protein
MTRRWSPNELAAIGAAAEVSVAPRRPDGALGSYITIWAVRVGDSLFVRSYRGPSGSWYRAAVHAGAGRIRAGGVERDVSFEQANAIQLARIDDAYRAKYGRSSYVDAMVGTGAASTTLRLIPLEPSS